MRSAYELDAHVTVPRDKFLRIEPTRCTNFSTFYFGMKLYVFRTLPLSIIRNFFCTLNNGICHIVLLIYTIAVWTEEMSETCRVSFQNNILRN